MVCFCVVQLECLCGIVAQRIHFCRMCGAVEVPLWSCNSEKYSYTIEQAERVYLPRRHPSYNAFSQIAHTQDIMTT